MRFSALQTAMASCCNSSSCAVELPHDVGLAMHMHT